MDIQTRDVISFVLGFGVSVYFNVLKHRWEEFLAGRTMVKDSIEMTAEAQRKRKQGLRHTAKWGSSWAVGYILFWVLVVMTIMGVMQ